MHGLARIHNCSYCDYSSATKAGLVVHERRHTGEREFVCEHCGASFHSRAGLVQHLPIHLPESNYECNICQKREKSKRLLQHHYHKVHKEKRLRYLCPVCEDVFKSSSATRQHLTKSHGVARHDQSAIQRFELSVPDST
ncbi:zinc finger protein 551-like [Ostrinia nubilalis]